MRVLINTMGDFKISLGYRLLVTTIPIGGLLIVDPIFRLGSVCHRSKPTTFHHGLSYLMLNKSRGSNDANHNEK